MWATIAIFGVFVAIVLSIYVYTLQQDVDRLAEDIERLEDYIRDRERRTPDFFKDLQLSADRHGRNWRKELPEWTEEWENEHRRF